MIRPGAVVLTWIGMLVLATGSLVGVAPTTAAVPAAVAVPRAAQPAATAVATTASPTDWANQCGSKQLGLQKDTVQLAPALTKHPDLNPDGTPVKISLDPRGRFTPVIMVHGWTSQDTNDDDRKGAFSSVIDLTANRLGTAAVGRSLVGQLQSIPGTAVFTFYYRDYAARWVDDSHLGPALGKVIDCLYQASGDKVIVVGHSMGGLIARYAAATPGVTGSDRSAEISTLVTFGTPDTGSVAALLGATGLDVGSAVYKQVAVLRMILSVCGQLSSKQMTTGSLCDLLPPPARAFSSDAGIALRAGSTQLRALKPIPKSIHVVALAGAANFDLGHPGWFGLPWDTASVNVGDLIVTTGSALNNADETTTVTCHYQLNPVSDKVDHIQLWVGLRAANDVAAEPFSAFSGPCFHVNLMRSIELTNEAIGAIHDDIAARTAAVTVAADKYVKSAGRWWFRSPDGRWNCSIVPARSASVASIGPFWCESRRFDDPSDVTFPAPRYPDTSNCGAEIPGLVGGLVLHRGDGSVVYGSCGHGDASEFVYDKNSGVRGPGRVTLVPPENHSNAAPTALIRTCGRGWVVGDEHQGARDVHQHRPHPPDHPAFLSVPKNHHRHISRMFERGPQCRVSR